MTAPGFAQLMKLLSAGEVQVVQVGSVWKEARLVRRPSAEHALIGVPAMLYLAGRLSAVVYAEMPVATGSRVRTRPRRTAFDKLKSAFRERRKASLLRFSVPDLGLSWHGEGLDEQALALARHFAQVLAEEFPDAEGQLTRHFHMEMPALVAYLSHLPYARADTTRPGGSA